MLGVGVCVGVGGLELVRDGVCVCVADRVMEDVVLSDCEADEELDRRFERVCVGLAEFEGDNDIKDVKDGPTVSVHPELQDGVFEYDEYVVFDCIGLLVTLTEGDIVSDVWALVEIVEDGEAETVA